MKHIITIGFVAAAVAMAGCGKHRSSPESSTTLSSLPALRNGDKSTAIADFLAVNWSAHPLFQTGSPLSHSEEEMHALRAHSAANYHAESKALESQLADLKELAGAVRDAGYDAVSKGDNAQAGKDFTALKQFGAALNRPEYTLIVQLVGQGYEKEADAALAKVSH